MDTIQTELLTIQTELLEEFKHVNAICRNMLSFEKGVAAFIE